MKSWEVIERLKAGDILIYDTGPRYQSAHFKGGFQTVRIDTAFKIRQSGLVNIEKSSTAHGVEYLTWKAN